MAQSFLSINVSPVAAAHVFQHHGAVHRQNLRLLAADAAIAQGQFVAGLAADAVRSGADRHLAADAARIAHEKSWCAWHRCWILGARSATAQTPSRRKFAGTAHGRESRVRSK